MYPKSIPKNYSNEMFLNIFFYGSGDFNFDMSEETLKAPNKFLKNT